MPSEHQLIEKYFAKPLKNPMNILGVGDDAALIKLNNDLQLAQSIDTMVEGVHFFPNTDPESLGHKCLAISLSDIAAMGARPSGAFLSLTLPKADEAWLIAFQRGFFNLAKQFSVDLLGGDTCQGPLSITTLVQGVVEKNKAILRSGAKSGDLIFVSGTLGDAGFAVSQKQAAADFFLQRLQKPTPRVELGMILKNYATAAIDISDGLATDLRKIITQSQVGAIINTAKIPLSTELQNALPKSAAINLALSSGDDYELCFTVPKNLEQDFLREIPKTLSVTCIGEINTNDELIFQDENKKTLEIKQEGYEHFR